MEELVIVIAKRVCSLRRPPLPEGAKVSSSSALGQQLRVVDPGRVHLVVGRNPVPRAVVEFAKRDPATAAWFGERGFLTVEVEAPPAPVVPALAGIPGVGVVLADGTLVRSKSQARRVAASSSAPPPERPLETPPEPIGPPFELAHAEPSAAVPDAVPASEVDLAELERLTRPTPSTTPETPKAKGGRK